MASTKSSAQLGYQQVQRETAKLLRPLGFRRRGPIIFKRADDNFGVIHFQSNRYSTRDELVFTLNVGVVIGKLVDPRAYNQCLKHPSSIHAQIRKRIGSLLPQKDDKWWTITEDADISESSKEFAELVLQSAVPFVLHFMKMENVLCEWEQGNAPGLTERQRVEYLAQLRTLLAERSSSPD